MTTTAKELHSKICPECGELFQTDKPAKVFCNETCRVAYANLSLSRGKSVVPLLVTWRRHRTAEVGKAALRQLCRIASMYIEEDRADKRECAIQVQALLDGFHVGKFDRPLKPRKTSKAHNAAHAA